MASVTAKNFDAPDETRSPDKATVELLDLGDTKIGRMTAQPGWRWSESIKPIVGGDSCQARHVGVATAGRLHVMHDDGTEVQLTAGNAYVIEPGHDAWVVGDDAFVGYEFEATTLETFAVPS